MGRGQCYEPHDTPPVGTASAAISCTAVKEQCPSLPANTCLKVTVSYNYASSPLFPILPGLGIITPSTIASTDVLQMNS